MTERTSVARDLEEWADADFDIPEGQPMILQSDAESGDEDWDAESLAASPKLKSRKKTHQQKPMALKMPPLPAPSFTGTITKLGSSARHPVEIWDDMDDVIAPAKPNSIDELDWEEEGMSTIKLEKVALPPPKPAAVAKSAETTEDEDMEDDFALPAELETLALRPLHHRPSKGSFGDGCGWGDHTSYLSETSSVGTWNSPSTNSTSYSQPETETDEDDDILNDLVVPDGMFDSGRGGKELTRMLDVKKRAVVPDERIKVASPDDGEDFEMGLVLDDQVDFSPSRLRHYRGVPNRSKSAPPRPPGVRPSSRSRSDGTRTRSPTHNSAALRGTTTRKTTETFPALRHLSTSPTPGSSRGVRSLASTSPPPPSSPPSSFLMPRTVSSTGPPAAAPLKHQKSHSRLQPAASPATTASRRHLARKASMSALGDSFHTDPSTPVQSTRPSLSSAASSSNLANAARYNSATYASRAKASPSYSQTASRLFSPEFAVPPTRPSTPSSNPAALRLTMPTSSSRLKARPPINSVWPAPTASTSSASSSTTQPHSMKSKSPSPTPYSRGSSVSPVPAPSLRSNSSLSYRSAVTRNLPPAAKVLKRPKRAQTFGDGTELDGFDDLPTNREQEVKYRVAPKGYSGSTVASMRKQISPEPQKTPTLKHKSRIEFPRTMSPPTDKQSRRKKTAAIPGGPVQRRKPTLIRNLSGAGSPKVVGDMRWNPLTLRWEGNDHVLRDFDSVAGSSTRPALITQLTGSSIGSPASSLAGGARVVGNMLFDPVRMCWINALPEEEEPDVFADMADDEEEGDGWESKGGTIRAAVVPVGLGVALESVRGSPQGSVSGIREDPPSPARSHTRSLSESESERGSRMYGPGEQQRLAQGLAAAGAVDPKLIEQCRLAEDRHRAEMKGWFAPPRRQSRAGASKPLVPQHEEERSYLFDIRTVATKKYASAP